MFIQINSEKIELDFNYGIRCTVYGPEDNYYVQVSEYVDGNDSPIYVEGYGISGIDPNNRSFYLPIEFFMDFEISVSKFVDGHGLQKIFIHRFCDYGQYVQFNLETKNEAESQLWVEKIIQYKNKRGCKVILNSDFEHLNKNFENKYTSKNITPYKTFKIGRHPKSSNDFRTTDERCEGLIWFGYWKKFGTYKHPRSWNHLNSEEIVNDILGL
jgi:hypothetical protein